MLPYERFCLKAYPAWDNQETTRKRLHFDYTFTLPQLADLQLIFPIVSHWGKTSVRGLKATL